MNILGIGGILSGGAAALLKNGQLAAAVEESKVSRYHLRGELPRAAIQACLRSGGLQAQDVDCLAIVRPFGDDPALQLQLRERFPNARLVVVEHHAAHAASAFYPSPFAGARVLTFDRRGDVRCGARWSGSGTELELEKELHVPDSLGDLYGRVTELLGFRPKADEHKLQWLSTSGDERFVELFENMFLWNDSDWPRLDRSWFTGERIRGGGFARKFYRSLGLDPDQPDVKPIAPHIASGMQLSLQRVVARMAGDAKRLCLAGGVAMNALLISSLEEKYEVFVQPAGGNAGTALGAVFYAWHSVYRQKERTGLGNLCLGPEFAPEEIKKVLENCKLRFRYLLTGEDMVDLAIRQLNDHQIVAWMHGRMEFGPRALGNRSILASPLNPYSTENLNVYIKHREPFRKFAASVIAEAAGEYFEVGPNARYLATVGRVKPAHRKTFESATLGNDLVRVHLVTRDDNPLFYSLLQEAGRTTGLPVLYNTSFNLFNDPLVCSPRDAARSFYSSGVDAMFVGHFHLEK
jgi:carbamoyltransferase